MAGCDAAMSRDDIPRLRQAPAAMANLDRLPWAVGLSLVTYGVRVGLRTDAPALLEAMRGCLPPGWRPASSPVVERLYSLRAGGSGRGCRHALYVGAEILARTADRAEVIERLEWDLRWHIAQAARRRIFLHAGVVGWQGRAIVLPGRSFAGKSTLV